MSFIFFLVEHQLCNSRHQFVIRQKYPNVKYDLKSWALKRNKPRKITKILVYSEATLHLQMLIHEKLVNKFAYKHKIVL